MEKTWDSPVKNLKHQQKLYGELGARKTDAEPTPTPSPLPSPKHTCMSPHIGKDTKPRFSQNPQCPSLKTVDCSGAIYNISFFIGINPTYKINRVKVTSVSKLEWLGIVLWEAAFRPGLKAERHRHTRRGCSFPRAACAQRGSVLLHVVHIPRVTA